MREIGYFVQDDDELTVKRSLLMEKNWASSHGSSTVDNDFHSEKPLSGLKYKFLKYMKQNSVSNVAFFYQNYEHLQNLIIWKCQIIDENTLLIKFGTPEEITSRIHENVGGIQFFAFYNFRSNQIISAFTNYSNVFYCLFYQKLYRIYTENMTDFMVGTLDNPSNFEASGFNNSFVERRTIEKQFDILKNAKNGGSRQAIKKSLCALPYSPQCFSSSPYFDLNNYSFDDKIVSRSQKPMQTSEYPIKFFSRVEGRLKFRLPIGAQNQSNFRLK